jgi:hypothetical protein
MLRATAAMRSTGGSSASCIGMRLGESDLRLPRKLTGLTAALALTVLGSCCREGCPGRCRRRRLHPVDRPHRTMRLPKELRTLYLLSRRAPAFRGYSCPAGGSTAERTSKLTPFDSDDARITALGPSKHAPFGSRAMSNGPAARR